MKTSQLMEHGTTVYSCDRICGGARRKTTNYMKDHLRLSVLKQAGLVSRSSAEDQNHSHWQQFPSKCKYVDDGFANWFVQLHSKSVRTRDGAEGH